VSIPIIADADDGYGNALSTIRTVQEYVKTGVAGIHLEDQRFPKRFGHIAGKTVVDLDEALGKYRAAGDTRNRLDPDFVIIARTHAYGVVGGSVEAAIRRGRAYADAGVDLVWCRLSNASPGHAGTHQAIARLRRRALALIGVGGAAPLPPTPRSWPRSACARKAGARKARARTAIR